MPTYDNTTWFNVVTVQKAEVRFMLQKYGIRSWDTYFAQIRDLTGHLRGPFPPPVLHWSPLMFPRIPTPRAVRAPLVIPTHVAPVSNAANAAYREAYERGLTAKERATKIDAIRHLIETGDPGGSMHAYVKTVPGLVNAVLAERFEGTPIPVPSEPAEAPWSFSEATPRREVARWSEPVLVAVEAPLALDASAVDELLAGIV